jgi:hypothetical protein
MTGNRGFLYEMSKYKDVRFQVLTAASVKMAVFSVVAPCSPVVVYRRFRGACCRAIALMMKAASTFETSVNFCQTTQRNNPEYSHLQVSRSPVPSNPATCIKN